MLCRSSQSSGSGRSSRATKRGQTCSGDASMITADSYGTLMSLAEQGALKPVIDSVLPFTQIIEAHRRVDTGHKTGSVVLTFTHGN